MITNFIENLQNIMDVYTPGIFNTDDFITIYNEIDNDPSRNYASQIARGGSSVRKMLSPWWVSGFVDAEGSFGFSTQIREGYLRTVMQFKVTQKDVNESVLQGIIDYFGSGKVHTDNSSTQTLKFQIQDISTIRDKVIPHFEKYPLMSSKRLDYNDWKSVFDILENKEHFTEEGKSRIIEVKEQMNNKRSELSRWKFLMDLKKVNELHPNWLQGFIDGEATFQFEIGDQKNRGNTYFRTNPTLQIAQSNHDVLLLEIIKDHLEGGYIKPKFNTHDFSETINSRDVTRYVNNDEQRVIDFVDKYPLETTKNLDYQDWKKLVEMKNDKIYQTSEGKKEMLDIKLNINRGRKHL